MFRRIRIGRHERGFLRRHGDYERCLRPGVHWLWGFGNEVRKVSTRDKVLDDDQLDVYLRDPQVWDDVVVVDLREDERAIVWIDGRLRAVLGPGRGASGRLAYWKELHEVKVETYHIDSLRFEHSHLDRILGARSGRDHLHDVAVPRGFRGVLYIDHEYREVLGPGRCAFWKDVADVKVELIDVREVALEIAGQEILTRDKVSLRINLSAAYRVTDPRLALESSTNLRDSLYRELQLALREAVGVRMLDELLTSKEDLGQEIRAAVEARGAALGAALGNVGIKDVILPGEMKTLLNQVIESEKRAQANVIERREETAATRSLLNTARLIEQSPTLLRLKELETAERMVASIDQVQVLGGGVDALIEQLLPRRTES